jgi:hypothetical protein
MSEEHKQLSTTPEPAHRVRLPGWLVKEEVGLGEVVKRVTYRTGIKPCSGCEKRAAALNRWIIFSRR